MKRTKIKSMNVFTQQFNLTEKREETLEGVNYLVVPVTMMVEGVHSGSRGPMLHTATELGKVLDVWNGRPIVINHPRNEEGVYVSANSPDILERNSVGFVFNTKMNDNKLIAEAWLDLERLQRIAPEVYTNIENNIVMEVSVGVFNDEDKTAGSWNGEQYTSIAYNHRPDHLAILPNVVGACSLADGGGLLVNEKGVIDIVGVKKGKELNKEEIKSLPIILNEDLLSILDTIRSKLYAQDVNNEYNYLMEVYNDFVIYKNEKNGKILFYKQSYQIASDKSIDWVGAPVQVIQNITYRPVPVVQNSNKYKKEVKMSNKEECPKCTEIVNLLITNEVTMYKEDDRKWLETLKIEQLEKMKPVALKKEEHIATVNTEKPIKSKQITKEEALNALGITNPKEYEEQMKFGLGMYRNQLSKMVENILTNTKDVWKKEELETMNFETLQKIAASLKEASPLTDYSVFGNPAPLKEKKDVIAPMPKVGYEFTENKN